METTRSINDAVSGALSLYNSLSSAIASGADAATKPAATGSTANRPRSTASQLDDVPKDELLALCMKMNKRLQTLEGKSAELLRRNKQLGAEREGLLDIVRRQVDVLESASGEIDISALSAAWEAHFESRKNESQHIIKTLDAQYKAMLQTTSAGSEDSVERMRQLMSETAALRLELQDSNQMTNRMIREREDVSASLAQLHVKHEGAVTAHNELMVQYKKQTIALDTEKAEHSTCTSMLQTLESKVKALERDREENTILIDTLKFSFEQNAKSVYDLQQVVAEKDKTISSLEHNVFHIRQLLSLLFASNIFI